MATLMRGILGTMVLILGLLGAAACAPAAAPTPVAAPTKPAPSPAAKSEEAAPAVAKPAATAAPKPAAEAEWKVEWDKTLAAAKKEGKVVVAGAQGELFRQAAMEFKKAYPEIAVEFTGALARDINARILAERSAGLYLWDISMGGSSPYFTELMPNNALDPLKPAVILPEVLDDSKWLGGFDGGFMDLQGRYVYSFFAYRMFGAHVNHDVAPELGSVDDLLDPKWKGKIAWQDPRSSGAGRSAATYLLATRGEEFYRKLLAQDIVPLKDTRQMLEQLVRGSYPVAFGTRSEEMQQFRAAGALGNVVPLSGAEYVTGGSGVVTLFNKAPNPNAAKVFINWLLSREGQRFHVELIKNNSRRLDVEGPAETAIPPGLKFKSNAHEEMEKVSRQAIAIAQEIVK